jgi:hypothetical protein
VLTDEAEEQKWKHTLSPEGNADLAAIELHRLHESAWHWRDRTLAWRLRADVSFHFVAVALHKLFHLQSGCHASNFLWMHQSIVVWSLASFLLFSKYEADKYGNKQNREQCHVVRSKQNWHVKKSRRTCLLSNFVNTMVLAFLFFLLSVSLVSGDVAEMKVRRQPGGYIMDGVHTGLAVQSDYECEACLAFFNEGIWFSRSLFGSHCQP